MADRLRQVAIVISYYNNRHDLGPCLHSVFASTDKRVQRHVVVVDNGSIEPISDWLNSEFPLVEHVRLERNCGFTGGNNAGLERVRATTTLTDYLVLLNTDTLVRSGWLAALCSDLEADSNIGCAQAKLLLHGQENTINSAGNRNHYLGFGMMGGYAESDHGQYDTARSIDFPSGAAVMIRMDLIARLGLFDECFHMYLEDADLGWKLRQAGFGCRFVPAAIVEHKYIPNAPRAQYENLERNRWILLLTYYKLPTLLLLFPAMILMEIGQIAYAVGSGLIGAKIRSWLWFFQPSALRRLRDRRRTAQRCRILTDRQFMGDFCSQIHLPSGDPWLLHYIGNPLLAAYWALTKRLICW